MPAERFADQVALVTGGSRGIGRAAAALFAAAGVKVAITYRSRKAEADSFVEEVSRAGGHAMAMQADFADSGAPAVAVEATVKEVGSRNITVNAVAPGFITTELTSTLPAELLERARQAAAIPRIGTPDDVAPAIVFLASPEASYITGQVLGIDGGLPI